MINIKKTIELFGYNPETTPKRRQTFVIFVCDLCKNEQKMTRRSYDNKECYKTSAKRCKMCPDYKKERSDIAKSSNRTRKTSSEKYKKYLPFLDDLRGGKITLLEISKKLNIDDSTASKFYSKNFGLKSRFGNKSLQEDFVFAELSKIFTEVCRSIRYSKKSRHIADFYINNIGFIEYDGGGFYHKVKRSDSFIDSSYSPIRLDAQAYYGGEDYLRFKLLNERSGYCSVNNPHYYEIRRISKISVVNDFFENCHPLSSAAGKLSYGLYHKDTLIGAAKFREYQENGWNFAELVRLYVLDGTPIGTKEFFIKACEELLPTKTKFMCLAYSDQEVEFFHRLGWICAGKKSDGNGAIVVNGKLCSENKIIGFFKKRGVLKNVKEPVCIDIITKTLGLDCEIKRPDVYKFLKEKL